MIYFIHNTFNRPKLVIKHSLIEKEFYPESKHLIVYNNDLKFELLNETHFFRFGENKGHKSGCLNAVYSGFKYLSGIKDISDDDIIIFSHDDCFLSNNEKFSYYLNQMNIYDFFGRRIINNKHVPDNCENYIMLESFIIKGSLIKNILPTYSFNMINDSDLMLDKLNSTSPEMNFGKLILDNTTKYLLIDITQNNYGENDMGYFHIENERGKGEL